MKRVCILIRSLAGGGAEKQSVLLAKALGGKHEIHFVVASAEPRLGRHLEALSAIGIEPTVLPDGPLRKVIALVSLLRSREVDVVFAHLPSDTLLAAIAGRLAGVPSVFGGIRNAWIAPTKWRVLRLLHNRVLTGSVSNSRAGRDASIGRGFAADRWTVIPNAIELDPGKRSPGSTPGERRAARRPGHPEVRVLAVGRLVAQKDFETTLRALAELRNGPLAERSVRTVIAGAGPLERDLRQRIAELGLAADVELRVDPGDLDALYAEADVYLSTSRFEGLPNAHLEAMSHSLPLVATDVGDVRLLVHPGVNGYLAPAGDHHAIAAHLRSLVEDDEARLDFGRHSAELAAGEFSFERFQERYLALVEAAA